MAYLGWGSLIWEPRDLPLRSEWFTDGPMVPIELTRQSQDGRITLVITPGVTPLPVLWARCAEQDLATAKQALAERERCNLSGVDAWSLGEKAPIPMPDLPAWAAAREIQSVLWTALPPKFRKIKQVPSKQDVVTYLGGLSGAEQQLAKTYIEKAPRQVDTEYRRSIEAELDWRTEGDRT